MRDPHQQRGAKPQFDVAIQARKATGGTSSAQQLRRGAAQVCHQGKGHDLQRRAHWRRRGQGCDGVAQRCTTNERRKVAARRTQHTSTSPPVKLALKRKCTSTRSHPHKLTHQTRRHLGRPMQCPRSTMPDGRAQGAVDNAPVDVRGVQTHPARTADAAPARHMHTRPPS